MSARLDHITLVAADLAASARFYDAALAPLGWTRLVALGDEEEDDAADEALAYGDAASESASLWLVVGPVPTRSAHVCLHAADRQAVQAFHDAAVAAGGTSHDAPRRWPIFRTGDFNAIVADPDGNLVEAVAAE